MKLLFFPSKGYVRNALRRAFQCTLYYWHK